MNENMNYTYDDEMEIDLIDLMFYLLKQWKTLLLAVLIGAILGSGIYVVKKNAAEAEAAAAAAAVSTTMPGEDTEDLLKTYQVDPDVKNNMELAYQYRQLYREQLEYNQKSMIMQMDPSRVYCGKVKYYISAGTDTTLVSYVFESLMEENDFLQKMKTASGLKCEEQYIRELIDWSVSRDNDATINIQNYGSDEAYFTAKNVIITYTVNSGDERSCSAMLQVIQDRVAELDESCRENYPEYEMTKVTDSVCIIANSNYLSQQKNNADQLNTYLTNMSRLESAFEEKDLEYYNLAYLSREYNPDDEEEEIVEPVVEPEPVSPVKWLLIGVFLMCVCWGGIYLARYLLNSRIKTSGEVQSMYRCPLLGRVSTGKPAGKGINGWLDRLYGRCKAPVDSVDYVAAAVDSLQKEELLVCGNASLPAVTALMQQLSGQCRKLSVGGLVSQDNKTLEDAKQADGVILAVQIGETRRAELQRELEVCRLQGVSVAGIVVVE